MNENTRYIDNMGYIEYKRPRETINQDNVERYLDYINPNNKNLNKIDEYLRTIEEQKEREDEIREKANREMIEDGHLVAQYNRDIESLVPVKKKKKKKKNKVKNNSKNNTVKRVILKRAPMPKKLTRKENRPEVEETRQESEPETRQESEPKRVILKRAPMPKKLTRKENREESRPKETQPEVEESEPKRVILKRAPMPKKLTRKENRPKENRPKENRPEDEEPMKESNLHPLLRGTFKSRMEKNRPKGTPLNGIVKKRPQPRPRTLKR
jgi:hypothetical protein